MSRTNSKKNNNRKRPPIESYDDIATRTRRQKMANAAKWDIPIPIIIEIISWLNQEDLMNMSLVSKQSHGIIANEPGNKNKILPVFEIRMSESSIKKLFQNLKRHFMNKKTKKTLQSYRIMRFKDVHKFNGGDDIEHLVKKKILKNTRMNGITSLDLSSSSPRRRTTLTNNSFLFNLAFILPNLREVELSSTDFDLIKALASFSTFCPLLEKVTLNNNEYGVFLCGRGISRTSNLKEINMNNVKFHVIDIAKMVDLNNHQEIFILHCCCKALERVSILNMKFQPYMFGPPDDINEDQKMIFTQNALIKFVRNVPSLRWLRSDLTSANIEMLQKERPGIELLN
jgi:hypothetical protein